MKDLAHKWVCIRPQMLLTIFEICRTQSCKVSNVKIKMWCNNVCNNFTWSTKFSCKWYFLYNQKRSIIFPEWARRNYEEFKLWTRANKHQIFFRRLISTSFAVNRKMHWKIIQKDDLKCQTSLQSALSTAKVVAQLVEQ